MGDEFPIIDRRSWFYKNCKRQRKNKAKICDVCPFRDGIEKQEKLPLTAQELGYRDTGVHP